MKHIDRFIILLVMLTFLSLCSAQSSPLQPYAETTLFGIRAIPLDLVTSSSVRETGQGVPRAEFRAYLAKSLSLSAGLPSNLLGSKRVPETIYPSEFAILSPKVYPLPPTIPYDTGLVARRYNDIFDFELPVDRDGPETYSLFWQAEEMETGNAIGAYISSDSTSTFEVTRNR